MIRSMTAFCAFEREDEAFKIQGEIRTVNSRFLDLVVQLPHGYSKLEQEVKNLVKEYISRGRVEIRIRIEDLKEKSPVFQLDENMAKAYYDAARSLAESLGLPVDLDLGRILDLPGVLKQVETETDTNLCWKSLECELKRACGKILEMRMEEGASLSADITERLLLIEELLHRIESLSDNSLELYAEKLAARIGQLLSGSVEIDEARILTEAAIMADRSDITEELVRAKSHVSQLRKSLYMEEPVGKKLNFLLQELNREVNTIGSKTEIREVSHLVVEIKSELEKLREQVQNIE